MKPFVQIAVVASVVVFLMACGGDTVSVPLKKEDATTQQLGTKGKTSETTEVNLPKDETTSTHGMGDISTNQKIFIIGDSTTFNRTTDGTDLGWGSHVKDYMIHPQNAFNLASGGQSSRSYKDENGWRDWSLTKAEILKEKETSDVFLFIQFGSNDRTDTREDAMNVNNKTTMPGEGGTFYTELKEYIDWSRANGVTPVLVTPIHVMYKETNGKLRNEFLRPFGNYIETMRKLAKNETVLLLDLAKKSHDVFSAYETMEGIIAAYGVFAKSGERQDYTHYSLEGAIKIGGWVKELSCVWGDKTLCAQFQK